MNNPVQLTREQTILLIFISSLGNILYTHTWIDNDTDRAAWVAAAAGILAVIPLALWIIFIGKKFPGNTLLDILELTFGKIPITAISIVYICINVTVAATMLNMFSELIKTFFNVYTPLTVILLCLIFVACLLMSGEFIAFVRTAEVLTIIGIGNYLISFIFAFPNYIHINYIIPIFDTTWPSFMQGTLFMTGAASESLLILMLIIKFIPHPGKHYLWIVYALAAAAFIFASAILIIIAMMSPELAKRIAFGAVNAAKLIQIGEFIRGLEVFIFGTYQFLAIGKTALCLYCAQTAALKIFPNYSPKLLLTLSALTILGVSLYLSSYTKAYFLAVNLARYILLPFFILILMLASWAVIKKPKANV